MPYSLGRFSALGKYIEIFGRCRFPTLQRLSLSSWQGEWFQHQVHCLLDFIPVSHNAVVAWFSDFVLPMYSLRPRRDAGRKSFLISVVSGNKSLHFLMHRSQFLSDLTQSPSQVVGVLLFPSCACICAVFLGVAKTSCSSSILPQEAFFHCPFFLVRMFITNLKFILKSG